MMSKERFRYILLLIAVVSLIVAIITLLQGCDITDCNTLILFLVFLGLVAAVIVSKFHSPRLGRLAVCVLGFGCSVAHVTVFVHRYHSCSWDFIVCNDLNAIIRPSIDYSTARNAVAFDYIYRFAAVLLIYISGIYTLLFKQHVAWTTLCATAVHYNLFVVIMTLYVYTQFPSVNLFVTLAVILLLSSSWLLYRAGRTKAQAIVLCDADSRQARWASLMAGHLGFEEHVSRLQAVISGGSLAPVCEMLDSDNKLVPITVLQAHADMDRLYRDCSLLNFFFQDWIRSWFPSGKSGSDLEFCNPNAYYKNAFKIRVARCFPDVIRGPIKAPNRVISKVIRQFISHILERHCTQGVSCNSQYIVMLGCRCTARIAAASTA
jgi:hypothetical protein